MESLFCCADVSTSDVPQFEHLLKSGFGATGFDLPDQSSAKLRHSFAQFHDLEVGFWSFGTSINVGFPPKDKAYLGLALHGKGTVTNGGKTVSADGPTLASPGRPLNLHYGADLEKIFVGFKSEALKRQLTALLGTPISRDLEFELAAFTSQEMTNGLVGLIRLLIQQTDSRRSVTVPLALRELEDAAIVQLLFASRHKFSEQLLQKPSQTTSNVIARTEQFIEAHWDQPITMEMLTEVAGVSGRTLFRSFTKARGYSPMMFARKVRLGCAHKLLSEPAADTTVTGVALACGFSNLGRFAQDYWNIFGELPSRTLNLQKPSRSKNSPQAL